MAAQTRPYRPPVECIDPRLLTIGAASGHGAHPDTDWVGLFDSGNSAARDLAAPDVAPSTEVKASQQYVDGGLLLDGLGGYQAPSPGLGYLQESPAAAPTRASNSPTHIEPPSLPVAVPSRRRSSSASRLSAAYIALWEATRGQYYLPTMAQAAPVPVFNAGPAHFSRPPVSVAPQFPRGREVRAALAPAALNPPLGYAPAQQFPAAGYRVQPPDVCPAGYPPMSAPQRCYGDPLLSGGGAASFGPGTASPFAPATRAPAPPTPVPRAPASRAPAPRGLAARGPGRSRPSSAPRPPALPAAQPAPLMQPGPVNTAYGGAATFASGPGPASTFEPAPPAPGPARAIPPDGDNPTKGSEWARRTFERLPLELQQAVMLGPPGCSDDQQRRRSVGHQKTWKRQGGIEKMPPPGTWPQWEHAAEEEAAEKASRRKEKAKEKGKKRKRGIEGGEGGS